MCVCPLITANTNKVIKAASTLTFRSHPCCFPWCFQTGNDILCKILAFVWSFFCGSYLAVKLEYMKDVCYSWYEKQTDAVEISSKTESRLLISFCVSQNDLRLNICTSANADPDFRGVKVPLIYNLLVSKSTQTQQQSSCCCSYLPWNSQRRWPRSRVKIKAI